MRQMTLVVVVVLLAFLDDLQFPSQRVLSPDGDIVLDRGNKVVNNIDHHPHEGRVHRNLYISRKMRRGVENVCQKGVCAR